jgi:YggT family protein
VIELFELATVRGDIADFLRALLRGYVILIIGYIVINLIFAFGARPAYNRYLDAVMTFLRDVSEPYLKIFRRFIPPLGPVDLSPIVGIIVLQIVGGILIGIVDDGA